MERIMKMVGCCIVIEKLLWSDLKKSKMGKEISLWDKFIVIQYFMIKYLPRTHNTGVLSPFCHAWELSLSGIRKLVNNYILSLDKNVFSERKDKHDNVFNSEKNIDCIFSIQYFQEKKKRTL